MNENNNAPPYVFIFGAFKRDISQNAACIVQMYRYAVQQILLNNPHVRRVIISYDNDKAI